MPSHVALTEEMIQKIIGLRRLGKSMSEIGRELGIHKGTVSDYVKKYQPGAERGEPPPHKVPGRAIDRTDVDGSIEMLRMDRPPTVREMMAACELDPTVWVPQYFTPNCWQGFAKMRVPAPGKKPGEFTEKVEKVQCYQSKLVCKRILCEEVEAAILQFATKHIAPLPAGALRDAKSKKRAREGFMVAWGLWDTHIGLYAWNSETRNDFDVNIARRRVLNSIDDMVEELRPYSIERVVMPIGNDYMHFDSVRHQTAFGSHFLDTDTRFAKVWMVALECLAYMVERALELSNQVDLLYVPGNHDTTSSFTLIAALAQRYRFEKRVKVDLGANPRKYLTFGGTLLGFDHGAEKKAGQLAMIFATEAKAEWSASTYREIQIGHTHQRREHDFAGVTPTNGVLVRVNPALCNNDMWHHRQGLIGEPVKSVEAWRYDRVGYRGSHVAWARDERKENE